MKLAIVYGLGWEDVNIPITAFSSLETARQTIKQIFCREADTISFTDKKITWKFKKGEDIKLAKQFFSYYDSGNGECDGISIQEIEEGEMKLFPYTMG